MSLSKHFTPAEVEQKWYDYWMSNEFFRSVPDEREPYTIVIPPPNVTGILHMGHMLNNTIQDVLIRRARMQGYNACWVPGTDHASIATEAKVVKMLREQGIKKSDIGREAFLKHAFEWKEKYGGIILGQLKKLGVSCDWDRTRFTMEDSMSKAVNKVFVDLHKKGKIYRGKRINHWDPAAKTSLSDQEVIYKEKPSKLYHLKYKVEGTENEFVTIATTRPETILGDTAICFHPDDERYTHLQGKKVIVPLVNRAIPTIYDDYVDIEFGTGALKVTPAHDANDFNLGKKHKLETIDIFNDDATVNDVVGLYVGLDRFKVRKQITADLEEAGLLAKVEEITNKVGYSERTDVVVEPKLTLQWYMSMEETAKPALEAVMNDTIKFFPDKYKNTYRHWMANIRDWCISRQLWWGQRIPAFYLEDKSVFVAETIEEALADLKQDEDVVDTWFSSWLWPISVFDGFETKEEVDYYYPTAVLVTGWDIIFLWVARMVMAGYEFRGELPFKDVYFTGMVRDEKGRKMSKQLGNSPDALKLIEDYGADGVRMGMLLCSPAGGDLLFDKKLVEQGRNFSNKIWNGLRLIKGWTVEEGTNADNIPAIEWFENKFNKVLVELEEQYSQYRISEALKTTYSFIWNDFFSVYLEMIKPTYNDGEQAPLDSNTYNATLSFFERLMQILHPIMPFITEEVYQQLKTRSDKESICVSVYPTAKAVDQGAIKKGEIAKELITGLRNLRASNGLSPKHDFKLWAKMENPSLLENFKAIVVKQGNLSNFEMTNNEIENTVSFLVGTDEFYVDLGIEIDKDAEKSKIQEEITYHEGFKAKIMKKLSNERFVNNAPDAVVEKERQKVADAEQKMALLKETLAKLG
ncbi:UNVERIFIED_CONTAM: hypothetical protein GTU68_023181 [Idotea baltica]|nr:hypothetical protein [Idotea baltica]